MTVAVDLHHLELHELAPNPILEWRQLLQFLGLTPSVKSAMSASTEALLKRSHELVVNTYDYLRSQPDTAAVLGWESGIDEAHLAERRRFFAVWLSRTIGMDTSDEFAYYLFRAGKFHAAHGPRHIHTPPIYVTGSIALVQSTFAQYMHEAGLQANTLAPAMAGWNRFLLAQLHLMQLGYLAARALDTGRFPIRVDLFGRVRQSVGLKTMQISMEEGHTCADLLRKFFNYHPQVREDALEQIWRSADEVESLWLETYPIYRPRGGWRVLLNGRDLRYNGGFATHVGPQDKIDIFPPGR